MNTAIEDLLNPDVTPTQTHLDLLAELLLAKVAQALISTQDTDRIDSRAVLGVTIANLTDRWHSMNTSVGEGPVKSEKAEQ